MCYLVNLIFLIEGIKMNKILKKKEVKEISSASGLEIDGNNIYAISDDSSWLFYLDNEMNVLKKY